MVEAEIQAALRRVGAAGRPVCAHCSLRSFGYVDGGAATLIRAFLTLDATLLVPSFSWTYSVAAPDDDRPERNGTGYDYPESRDVGAIFTTAATEVDRDMGALSRAVVAMTSRVRGDHPLCSFSALGRGAADLVQAQAPDAVWAPLERLVESDGTVILMGVDFTRLTLAHLAEECAGRHPFVRWARMRDGTVGRVQVGSCSDGFGKLEARLPDVIHSQVGSSRWMVLSARNALRHLTDAIKSSPSITMCGDPACERCRDAVAGGPAV